MKKQGILKLIAAVCAVSASGCSSENVPPVPGFSAVSASQSFSASYSSETSSSASSAPFSSEISSSSTLIFSPPEFPDSENEMYIVYNPRSERIFRSEGNKLVITGRIDSEIKCQASRKAQSAEKTVNGDTFTFTVTYKNTSSGYDLIIISPIEYYKVHLDNGKARFVVCDDVMEINRNAVRNATDQPLSQVRQYIAYNASDEEIRDVLGRVKSLSDEICAGLTDDYDKLRAISYWVSENIYYDTPAYDKGVPEQTNSLKYILENHSGVCGGYSNITSALAYFQGIKVYNVHGSATTSGYTFEERTTGEYHEWNYALLGGRVVIVDSGWNSGNELTYSGYEKGAPSRQYFDMNEAAFSQDHKARYAEYRDYGAVLN